jgi:plasmid stabilization system protein ParE
LRISSGGHGRLGPSVGLNEGCCLGTSRRGFAANFSISGPTQSRRNGSRVTDIDRKFENLSYFPFIGRERSSLARGLRSIVANIHVIFYTVERERIVIVRVLDGRRDIDAEFQR